MKKKYQDNLQKRNKEKPKVKMELLQRIKVETVKINRYQQRMSQFQQNSFS